MRDFQFGSFSKVVPSEEQRNVARELIKSLNMTQSGEDLLDPESTWNESLQIFYSTVAARGLDPEAPIAALEDDIKRFGFYYLIILFKCK